MHNFRCVLHLFFFDAISISRNTPIGHLKYLSDVNNFTHYYGLSVFINMNIDFFVQIRSLYQNRDPSWKYNRSWNCYFYIKLTLKLVNRWFWLFGVFSLHVPTKVRVREIKNVHISVRVRRTLLKLIPINYRLWFNWIFGFIKWKF